MIAFYCAHCDGVFCWGCEVALHRCEHEIKTIGSRYCPGCVAHEAAANGVSVETVLAARQRRWGGEPCEHRADAPPPAAPRTAWKLTIRACPGAPIRSDYECPDPEHGAFEATLPRDASGDPPAETPCPVPDCGKPSPWRPSRPLGRVKLGEMDQGKVFEYPSNPQRVLDTRPLADGMPLHEWRKKQLDITRDANVARRRQKTGRGGKVFIG